MVHTLIKGLLWFIVLGMGSNDLSVLSYNIRYANPKDGEDQWEYRRDKISDYLQKSQPDVVGMQEVLEHQLNYLLDQTQGYVYVGVGRDDGKTKGEYSPILYRTASLQLIESNTFWLSPTPDQISVGWDAALPRICTYARFEHRKSKKQFWVFNTHFDHIGEEARKQAASLIIETIEKVNQDQLPVVVTGDFNLTPDTDPIQLLQAKYEDIMGKSVSTDLHYGTFNGFDLTQKGDRRIDYIFQKGFSLKRAKHLWIKTDEGRWASDHHPVYARLKF